jgi:transglutaminase-like putative cysteine protease
VQDLPEETLVFLLGSRYCETDRLTGIAWDLFGRSPAGTGRIHDICDYVHRHISFSYQDARSTRTACDAPQEGKGVCRDYAHLAIKFCRCMNIPARYCTGYLGDIGIPPPNVPMDFAAWFEASIGGRWHTPEGAMRRMWRSATRSVPTRSRGSGAGPIEVKRPLEKMRFGNSSGTTCIF